METLGTATPTLTGKGTWFGTKKTKPYNVITYQKRNSVADILCARRMGQCDLFDDETVPILSRSPYPHALDPEHGPNIDPTPLLA